MRGIEPAIAFLIMCGWFGVDFLRPDFDCESVGQFSGCLKIGPCPGETKHNTLNPTFGYFVKPWLFPAICLGF